MMRQILDRICDKNGIWRIGFLPGITVIIFVVLLRIFGTLQFAELAVFDAFLRLRPQEDMDERILIVGINEEDIKRIKNYPIPDRDIAALINKLKTYQPAVIGLDIVRDLPQEPGHKELIKVFKGTKDLIGIEKALADSSGSVFNAPPNLPSEQVGCSDAVIDIDGKNRRSLLATSNTKGIWRKSFALKLAEIYLKTEGISLGNVNGDPYGMRFSSTILTRFQPNFGGYVKEDAGGSQILVNFRNRRNPFHIVSLEAVQTGKVNPDLIRGKIVLIAMTSPSAKDYVNSSAIHSENPALIYGVEFQAHAVSQLISSVLDNRPLINVWADEWEYLWIIVWGISGLSFTRIIRSPWKILIFMTVAHICLLGICYGLLIWGLWVPFVPALLTLGFNYSGVLIAFYKYDEALQSRIQERQLVIDQTFDAIHSQPLQRLNIILRKIQSEKGLESQSFVSELQQLNQELRDVYDLVRKEAVTELNSFYLRQGQRLDLLQPLHELLHDVYIDVLERDYTNFKNIKLKIVKFEIMDERGLNIQQKRSLCRFLEEALCNVGKYAEGTTRLRISCTQGQGKNIIRVADNGLGIDTMANLSANSGFGTKQAQNLAKQIGGKFERTRNSPKGMVCQLTWPACKLWF
jgi:CHASE2 domain-containing sensor protein/two-component sensor histidine kinase